MKYTLFFLLFTKIIFSQVKFSADFESGNIGEVKLIDSLKSTNTSKSLKDSLIMHLTYEVSTKIDPLNPVNPEIEASARWFYFRITGVKNKFITLKLKLTDALKPVYSYNNQDFIRFDNSESPRFNQISKFFEKDTVYLAYITPYTFSYLQKRINFWNQNQYTKLDTIGYSLKKFPIQLLTITDRTIPDSSKKRVWIHARNHPSETPSSWHLDGIISKLLDSTECSREYLKKTIYYIVPFANPDGVVFGLSRSNYTGVNQEVNWDKPDSLTVIEIKSLKKKILSLVTTKPLDILLNLHSQVENCCTFWVHNAQSTSEYFYNRELLFCYLNMFNNPYLFKRNLSFSNIGSRYAEGLIWEKSGDKTMAITYETPYCFYDNRSDYIKVTTDNLIEIGNKTVNAIGDYLGISTPARIIVDNNVAEVKGKYSVDTTKNTIYYGNNCIKALSKNCKIYYNLDSLSAGKYEIYKWIPEILKKEIVKKAKSKKSKKNIKVEQRICNEATGWKKIQSVILNKKEKFTVALVSKNKNEIFDAIMLLKQ